MMPLITAVIIGVSGGLTLWLQDETFIKMKLTIIQAIFGTVLISGLLAKRLFLKSIMGAPARRRIGKLKVMKLTVGWLGATIPWLRHLRHNCPREFGAERSRFHAKRLMRLRPDLCEYLSSG